MKNILTRVCIVNIQDIKPKALLQPVHHHQAPSTDRLLAYWVTEIITEIYTHTTRSAI